MPLMVNGQSESYAAIMHPLVANYGDCGLDEEIEAVKREWWNVVTENSWEYVTYAGGEEKV
ncbi:MAG: hypothetical protein LUI85_21685 [Bacteroides sp.]|nr:hypothetical protein [Bacteroides sp.]